MAVNPFSPSSGATPRYFIGRDEELRAIQSALDAPVRDESTNTLVTGLRGTGKTVLLNKAREAAQHRNWIVLDTYLSADGLLDRIHAKVDGHLNHSDSHLPRISEAQLSVPVFHVGVEFDRNRQRLPLDDKIGILLSRTSAQGVLITVDEVHATAGSAQEPLRQLGNEIQLMQRRKLNVIAVMAGLPGGIRALLADRDGSGSTPSTFLRRAHRLYIGSVSIEETREAYAQAASDSGKFVPPELVNQMAMAANGYPYLFQLIGYHVWKRSEPLVITTEAVKDGVAAARRRLGEAVHDTALADLSNLDRSFLLAMSRFDAAPVPVQFISEQLGMARQNVNNYRRRLVDAGMITVPQRGMVDFSMPYMRDYLREHQASMPFDDDW